jgi:asparagine synthase (glutamine-hydrolysing)
MVDVLRHRGPDSTGGRLVQGEEPHVSGWLGHARLKILDLSERAEQPMPSADGTVLLTYNGEVYNFRELRRELTAKGHAFGSTGDTEVVLRAYEEWGTRFVEHLDGMFALAVWDSRRRRLVLARDRTGKKPLFYAMRDRTLIFGSEIKAIAAFPAFERRPDLGKLAAFLTFGYVPHPGTLLEGVLQVPPASVVEFGPDGVREPHEYWTARPSGPPVAADRALLDRIAALTDHAVRSRMISDVPLGALLSGGMDSSVIVALMARAATEPVHTFSIGFADDPSFDERAHAARLATRLGTRHTEFVVRMDAVGLLDRLLWHHDQPFADSSAIPTYAVCRLAREHVTVALNGDGGDEVFGGYDRFRAAALSRRLPLPLARAARAVVGRLPVDHGYYSTRRRAERFVELADAPLEVRYQSWISVVGPEMHNEMLAGALRDDTVLASMEHFYGEVSDLPPLDRILYANFKTYLPDDLAVKMDRMSMANSLETRSPLLDTALIEELARVRARDKVGLRRVKPLLRAALRPLLPDDIWDRRKHGFGVPMGAWFRGELGDVYADEVLATDARTRDMLESSGVRRLHEEHVAGEREHGFRMWTILTLERWLRSLERPLEPTPPSAPALEDAASATAAL